MKYELAATFVFIVFAFGVSILAWAAYEAFQGFRDHVLGHYRRIKNRRIDAAVGRVAYSFVRGMHYRG